MNRLKQELQIIPPAAWIVALLIYGGIAFLLLQVSPWPTLLRVLFSFGLPLMVAVLVLLIGYVYGDARRRGMRYVLWTLLAIFIPNAIGIILYFILRDPIPQSCRQCGAAVPAQFPHCPVCGTAIGQTCPECRRKVESEWLHCAHCGASLSRLDASPSRDH
jgi:hypothetical protein